ncbi:MAG TPA: hypothetical protein VEK57_23105 [Thermoanaerobaculia bacterium]|nr:hypothetical protein [Thermoanaerobaculia bacterium]
MLIDRYMPHCDFYERHELMVRATPERIYAAIPTAGFGNGWIIRTLLRLRGMRPGSRRFPPAGFQILAEDPPREMVIGVEGPFWNPTCKLRDVSAETFTGPVPPGVARGAWNFFIAPDGKVSTETRVLCADDSRAKFQLYWLAIRPFSGLIRRLMLRAIRVKAERP